LSRKTHKKKSRSDPIARAEALMDSGHFPAAIAILERALARDSTRDALRYALGSAWLEVGEGMRAKTLLSEISDRSLTQKAVQKISEADAFLRAHRSASKYVRHLFDQFAADYDSRMLGELHYRAPLVLRGLADLVLGHLEEPLDILDLGCGTGLAGEAFKDIARTVDGVDLSPLMIEKARARGLYDALFVADLETVLAGGRAYDLLLAADSLVYFGDLASVFQSAVAHLKPGGSFLFTVERKDGEGYELGLKRRYRHSEDYLRAEAAAAGLEIMGLIECTPRYDAGEPVIGIAAALLRRKDL
jgi:predicted TPR repeat methyltransferase